MANDKQIILKDKKEKGDEITQRRTENSKVYHLDKNFCQEIYYPLGMHVVHDGEQTYSEIENDLCEDSEQKHIACNNGKFAAKFNCDEANDELFSIERDEHKVTVLAKKNHKKQNKGMKPTVCKNEKVEVCFPDAETGSDYKYYVESNGVKEDIVVKEKTAIYRYAFIIKCENVTPVFDELSKQIVFMDATNNEEVFVIPAPFMTDANGAYSTAVSYEMKNAANGDVHLTVVADSEWINSEERVFPVVIDPQVKIPNSTGFKSFSWKDGVMSEGTAHTVGVFYDCGTLTSESRMYMQFDMPSLPRNPRIKKAELKLTQMSSTSVCGTNPKIGLFHITDEIRAGTCTPTEGDIIDYALMQTERNSDGSSITYTFDITTLFDMLSKNETTSAQLGLKVLGDFDCVGKSIILYGDSYTPDLVPQIAVTYESSYGVNTSYRTHTHELGRFGQGSIDLQCGNLMFESQDFAWGGNRMPVTIKHLYNSALSDYQYTRNETIGLNTANFSAMKLGKGFKLNIMQSMLRSYFKHGEYMQYGYVFTDENGSETYFIASEKTAVCKDSGQTYRLFEDIDSGEIYYDDFNRILSMGDVNYVFDANGRLIKIQEGNNAMVITYTLDKITSVTDGAGRDFGFVYNESGYLKTIVAPNHTPEEPVLIQYTYVDDKLDTIIYEDGRSVKLDYISNKPSSVLLSDSEGNGLYRVEYTFNGDKVESVYEFGKENGVYVAGSQSEYTYSIASGRTIVSTTEVADTECGETEDTVINTVYTFDDEGNIVSEYAYTEDMDKVAVNGGQSGINPYSSNGISVVNNINNLLVNHNFNGLTAWEKQTGKESDLTVSQVIDSYAKYGNRRMSLYSNGGGCKDTNGIYQVTNILPVGEYAFSVYLNAVGSFSGTSNSGAYIRVTTTDGDILAESERLSKANKEFVRLVAPFEIKEAQSVIVQIMIEGTGCVYINAAQLENNPYANAYNMLENGNFEHNLTSWSSVGATASSEHCFNMTKSLKVIGNVDGMRGAHQNVYVCPSQSTRETLTLSGWAKGYGMPNHERYCITKPTFRLRAEIKYVGETETECYTADFSPCTEDWQFASVEFAKTKYLRVEYVKVSCDYDYNMGTAYFDNIQLVRSDIEKDLSAEDFVVENDQIETASETAVVDDSASDFEEVKDAFGNLLTETTFTDGEFGTIYRAFGFTTNGNDLTSETDARGNETLYTVDEDTSRNEEVIDRCGNKTVYEYDESGKATKVASMDSEDTELANVSYAYDAFDNMTEIARGDGMKYVLAYNAYHNLESIGVNGKDEKLVQYTYKSGNGKLKEIAYANGDKMKATYNGSGQLTGEKWYDVNDTLTAYYKYTYDNQGNIVRSLDILACKEYNYEYEMGKLIRANECDIVVNEDEFVVSKTVVNTVFYIYNNEDILVRKRIVSSDDNEHVVYYEQSDNNTIVKFVAGGKTVTSHSKNDSFGRKVFDELQLGTGFVSRQFSYLTGEVTDEHVTSEKLKSSPTTQLVSQIVLSDGRSISYEYDEEERITKVIDSIDGTTEYTYDALGQLKTETVNGVIVNDMTYDNYGNILTKNGVSYTYGDAVWKDKLTKVGNQEIVCDDQGNPTTYLGHTLTWEKGRQLKSFDNIQYTYNANGIRTSKTFDGVRHDFALDGSKILRETWGNNNLVPLYDNEETVCGIIYNDEPFYFHKNLQGDIIAIVDKTANIVAKYTYDAWGACTIVEDTSGCGISTINPYRYRGYYFDQEIGLYYLQSRYYNPVVGRFVNSDIFEMISLSVISRSIHDTNLFLYCSNAPINDKDVTGYMTANQVANIFSISALFVRYKAILYASYYHGLATVSAYVANIATPIALKAFWWKPLLAAALIVAAVAIVVGAIAIYFSKQSKKTAKERSKDSPSWLSSAMNGMPPHWGEKAKDYAKRLMDRKYGKGNWRTGPGTEYNKIVKYLTRHLGMP